jgi:hypothetical protein
MQQLTIAEFLRLFLIPGGLLQIAVGDPGDANWSFWDVIPDDMDERLPLDSDVFFAPAQRKRKGAEKTDVLGTRALWSDADYSKIPHFTLPPSLVVHSGHGWHLYWFMEEPLFDTSDIERLNKLLMEDVGGDHCWNCNRFLRIPGSTNTKDPVARVEVRGDYRALLAS